MSGLDNVVILLILQVSTVLQFLKMLSFKHCLNNNTAWGGREEFPFFVCLLSKQELLHSAMDR